MTKRILALLIALPVAIIIIALSLANRRPVQLDVPNLSGEPLLSAQLPLFVVLFVTLFAGLVIGSLATWVRQGRHRRKAATNKVEATRAEFEAAKQRERAEELAARQAQNDSSEESGFPARAVALGLPAPTPRKAA